VISVHTGLGPLNSATGKYANANVVNASVLAAMNDGAILVNYDRGECVDAAALDQAMASGKIRYAAIDADLFVDPKQGPSRGPWCPISRWRRNTRAVSNFCPMPRPTRSMSHASRVRSRRWTRS
jgi:lactate dehydrogenase-like 2-hydroxyacid dehydrogenase